VIVSYRPDGQPTLVDREALALLTRRSAETIRRRCRVERYRGGRALYILHEAVQALAEVPQRQRPA
jgi:hypothetical protein